MDTMQWLVLVVVVSGLYYPAVVDSTCPQRCSCFRTTVRCMFLQLKHIPRVDDDTTILDLRFNKIKRIPPGTFRRLGNLNTLLLNDNEIKALDDDSFVGLTRLNHLYLYKNRIKTISSGAFHELTNLKQLYLHYNAITELDENLFSNTHMLENINLHNNRITRIPRLLLEPLDNLKRLRLDANPLECSCEVRWLSELLRAARGITQATVTCQYPARMQGRSLLELQDAEFNCVRPHLMEEPTDVDVTFGDSAEFRCRAEGEPTPHILWLHNDDLIVGSEEDPSSRYTMQEDGTLTVHNTQEQDQGVYTCIASNIVGDTRAAQARLRHTNTAGPSPARILRGSTSRTVTAGDDVTLECVAVGFPEPSITWTRNGEQIPEGSTRFTTSELGSLTIQGVQYHERGEYACTATNSLGFDRTVLSLNIQVRPTFVVFPADQVVSEAEGVAFRCQARGHPQPSISWVKDDELITMGSSGTGSPYIISPDGSGLTIERVREADVGMYECVAENPAGSVTSSAQLELQPNVAPTIINEPSDVRAPVGSSILLECNAIGHPVPTVTWYHANTLVLPQHHLRAAILTNGNLQLFDLEYSDRGLYECIAENSVGSVSSFVTVNVLPATGAAAQTFLGDRFVRVSVDEAISTVNRAINSTLKELFDPSHHRTPHDLFSIFRLPSTPEAKRVTRAAEIYERTLEIVYDHVQRTEHKMNVTKRDITEFLSPSHLSIIANLSGCEAHRRVLNCSDMCYHHKYRTYDGSCNNLKHAMWGASLTGFKRLLPPDYENGFSTPQGWTDDASLYNGYIKPSARLVSTQLASVSNVTLDTTHTNMVMQWGQFIDHDLDFTPMAISNARFSDGRHCNDTCENESPCFPIPVPSGDARIRRHRCIGVTRSSAVCGTGTTSVFYNKMATREQMNQITSYIDASNVYGSSEEEATHLRDMGGERGLLRTGIVMAGKPLMPFQSDFPIDCQLDANTAHVPCFQGGDVRANEQLALLSMHNLWLREHNRVATRLLQYNQHWHGDKIYHEARKIVGAQLQHITYEHWLPNILGPTGMKQLGPYRGYDPNVDASILNSFATAAFRFGHGLVNPIMYRLDEDFEPIPQGNLPLHKAFFAPFRILEEKGIDPLIRGLFAKQAKKLKPDEIMNTELTEKLFMLAHEVALDLAAINIQRGRDHGLPGYNRYRQLCGLHRADSFHELQDEITNSEVRRKLRALYGHPDNIDLWIGGMAEDPVEGALMGPTFMCIIVKQFDSVRHGDRFWYENPDVFSSAQLTEIRQSSIARIICDNSDGISRVQQDVFHMPTGSVGLVPCDGDQIPHINLQQWTECCNDCSHSGEFNSIASEVLSRKRRSTTRNYSLPADKPPADSSNTTEPQQPPPPPQQRKQSRGNGNRHRSVVMETADQQMLNRHQQQTHAMHNRQQSNEQQTEASRTSDAALLYGDVMDEVEARIEGVEDIMSAMAHKINHLTRKIERLSRHRPQLTEPTGCTDSEGQTRHHNEQWKQSACVSCECTHGHTSCRVETCEPVDCDNPTTLSGQCCPVC